MNASPPRDAEIYRLIMLVRRGGSIVSAAACGSVEIAVARSEQRHFVDKDGFAYVYRPKAP